MDLVKQIAVELAVKMEQVKSAVDLLDEGATVPFIARYRKEKTGGLDDQSLRLLEERLVYLRELEQRKQTVLKSIEEQGKLDPALKSAIEETVSKTRLEDLYRPYMPKRRTKAQIAREAGLQPLAESLLADPSLDPAAVARGYLNEAVTDTDAALQGAQAILLETFAENAALLEAMRKHAWDKGVVTATVVDGKENEAEKFRDYFEYQEAVNRIPSHRCLALFRGQKEGFLKVSVLLDGGDSDAVAVTMINRAMGIKSNGGAAHAWLQQAVQLCWRVKLSPHMDSEIKRILREHAERDAIGVFAENLKDLLLAAPAGPKVIMGLDPGIRTGVKVAVVDETGKVLDTGTIYPHAPKNQWDRSMAALALLCEKHKVQLIGIGNGTASRETDQLVTEMVRKHGHLGVQKLVVSEAGASVYSASKVAAEEFPDLDVSLRGAVSIARRLQDPLAELVKIDPKSIGVGQYQHDVNQIRLGKSLDNVVEDCVNAVGVDVNTASVMLLKRVAGLNVTIAQNVVDFRNDKGAYKSRRDLLKVPRLGPKAFEQSAGFLRIANGQHPLDASAVHPEAYPLVEKILNHYGKPIADIMGNKALIGSVEVDRFTDDRFGEPTVRDILRELEKPGRDPRPGFQTANFKEGVHHLGDLKLGMRLEGVVTNVTKFGAFVDVGVHQVGLLHISEMADQYVSNPFEVVKAGDIIDVTVIALDLERRRVALSRRAQPQIADVNGDKTAANTESGKSQGKKRGQGKDSGKKPGKTPTSTAPRNTAMADAFAKLKK